MATCVMTALTFIPSWQLCLGGSLSIGHHNLLFLQAWSHMNNERPFLLYPIFITTFYETDSKKPAEEIYIFFYALPYVQIRRTGFGGKIFTAITFHYFVVVVVVDDVQGAAEEAIKVRKKSCSRYICWQNRQLLKFFWHNSITWFMK